MAYNYSNVSKTMQLTVGITVSDTQITVDDATGLPIAFPYRLAIDYEQSLVEVVYATARTGNVITVQRGREDTPAQPHSTGAVVVHAATAADFQDMAAHIDASQNVHGIGSGNAVVGTGTVQTLTNKTMSGANNTFSNIPGSAIANSPTLHNATIDNAASSATPTLTLDTTQASTQPTLLAEVRNSSDGIRVVPGDASPTTFDFIDLQNPAGTTKFKVAQDGGATVEGASTFNAKVTVNQPATGFGAEFVNNASAASHNVVVHGHQDRFGLLVKRNNGTTTGTLARFATEADAALVDIRRDGSIFSESTVEADDFIINGTPDRSVSTELNTLNSPGWQAYGTSSTVLTSTGTNPTLGNSTFDFDYTKINNDLVVIRFRITIGSTFSAGSGSYRFLLPLAQSTDSLTAGAYTARIVDAGNTIVVGAILPADSTHVGITIHGQADELNNSGPTGSGWATNDQIQGSFIYEPA